MKFSLSCSSYEVEISVLLLCFKIIKVKVTTRQIAFSLLALGSLFLLPIFVLNALHAILFEGMSGAENPANRVLYSLSHVVRILPIQSRTCHVCRRWCCFYCCWLCRRHTI